MRSQMTLQFPLAFPAATYAFGERASGESHGVVLTKPHIVELILDLSGYTEHQDLPSMTLLEPACGRGVFLAAAATRLARAAKRQGIAISELGSALTAFDIDPQHVSDTRSRVASLLRNHGLASRSAGALAAKWVQHGDFLLSHRAARFDAIVGNPPYVRIEQIPSILLEEYRRRFRTLFDRADLYVAFIEHALGLLKPNGILSFICADRWTLNRYGAPLRDIITREFAVRAYVDLHTAAPFESEVIAYPAIFAIGRTRGRSVAVAKLATASPEECDALRAGLRRPNRGPGGNQIEQYGRWFSGDEPWVLTSPAHLQALRDLEARFAPLEAHGDTRVRIGVATGSDAAYIVGRDVDIESDRLVPLVMREDIHQGMVRNAGRFVINTFAADGRPVNLAHYPRLARHLHEHAAQVRLRHIAQKNPTAWFRTIDRVYPDLVKVPKLLIPDIAGANEIALDPGEFHPHHNLYFVTSSAWELEALGGLLSSRVALFFVWSYAVKMRGGYLRFQAQYLRRIRLPSPQQLAPRLAKSLRSAFRKRDFARLDHLALEAFELRDLPAFDFVDTRA